jgi:hypothetical protein
MLLVNILCKKLKCSRTCKKFKKKSNFLIKKQLIKQKKNKKKIYIYTIH